ncbi:MAG TPA: BON domain-containing protein [Elusimicrobiota bacterium]|nr:BON domain-containing protein [Elusimicrobiota bacterium]
MDDPEAPRVSGAISQLLDECRERSEALYAGFQRAEDAKTKRRLAEAAAHELKVRAAIAELLPLSAPGAAAAGRGARRRVPRLFDELETMTGDECVHDWRFKAVSKSFRRCLRENAAAAALVALALAAAGAGAAAQSNQTGGEQLNSMTSPNTIANGGSTGAAVPVDKTAAPVTPAAEKPEPASNDKDHPAKLRAPRPRKKRKLSDRVIARRIRAGIVHDLSLPQGSKNVTVSVSAGRVLLTGTVLSGNDKYGIAAKAAAFVGAENVVNLIEVKPAERP